MNEKDLPKQLGYSRTIENSGRLDGFVVYFNGYFDDDIYFTSHPLEYRSNNWAFRILRVETSYFEKGDSIQFNLNISSWINPETWQWRYFKNNLL